MRTSRVPAGPSDTARSSPSTSTRAGAATGPPPSSTRKLTQKDASVTPKSSGSVMRCATVQTYPRSARKSSRNPCQQAGCGRKLWLSREAGMRERDFTLIDGERVDARRCARSKAGHVRVTPEDLERRVRLDAEAAGPVQGRSVRHAARAPRPRDRRRHRSRGLRPDDRPSARARRHGARRRARRLGGRARLAPGLARSARLHAPRSRRASCTRSRATAARRCC